MCGIVVEWGDVNVSMVQEMMERLVHRGPDAEGTFVSRNTPGMLGHRRLSIMDPEGGNQPIFSENRTKVIIANGEIYNFPQLLPELSDRHQFQTSSDSEAMLHLYEDHAKEVVNFLDGMFAFVIVADDKLYAARDPIGIKPLYFAERNNALLFASELKAFPSGCDNIQEFPPGTYFCSDHGFSNFYEVPDIRYQPGDAEMYAQKLRKTVEVAVGKRLMSDVPLGTFLSGGLDSSIIAAIVRKEMDSLHSFTVGIEGSRDLEAARRVARHLDTIHHEYVIPVDEIEKKLPDIIYYLESFDQDLVRSAIPCYFTARLAADYVKVVLTGEGADELFGGYTYYKEIRNRTDLHSELRRSVTSLHNINLQRVDRMTMAHSIEGRVPFLDLEMIRLGQLIPPELKLSGSPPVEKWILRKTFEDLLPPEILWRSKEQFDEGSGTVDALNRMLADSQDPSDVAGYSSRFPDTRLRSAEECHYHRLFLDLYEDPEPILSNVARWSERPPRAARKELI